MVGGNSTVRFDLCTLIFDDCEEVIFPVITIVRGDSDVQDLFTKLHEVFVVTRERNFTSHSENFCYQGPWYFNR